MQVLYYEEHNMSNTLSSQQTTKRSDQLLDSWLVNMSSSAWLRGFTVISFTLMSVLWSEFALIFYYFTCTESTSAEWVTPILTPTLYITVYFTTLGNYQAFRIFEYLSTRQRQSSMEGSVQSFRTLEALGEYWRVSRKSTTPESSTLFAIIKR